MNKASLIDIGIFKTIIRAVAHSDHLETMADRLTQLLVASMGIKGCTIFALNVATDELEILASFGLSVEYLNKGPVLWEKSMHGVRRDQPIVIEDISGSDRLQYPQSAQAEGIQAIVSIPIRHSNRVIGALRLYHGEPWNVSETDLDSLLLLGEHIGLALTYVRVVNALRSVKETVGEVHSVWLETATE